MPRHSTRVVYRMLAWRWILYLNYKRNGPRTNFELRPANSGREIAREPVKYITKKTTVTLRHYKCTNTFWMHMSRMVVFSMFLQLIYTSRTHFLCFRFSVVLNPDFPRCSSGRLGMKLLCLHPVFDKLKIVDTFRVFYAAIIWDSRIYFWQACLDC